MNMKEILENVLRARKWGLYDIQNPIQKLNMSGEAPLFKVNEVDLKYLAEEIETAMKEEQWKKPQSNLNQDGSQENISNIG